MPAGSVITSFVDFLIMLGLMANTENSFARAAGLVRSYGDTYSALERTEHLQCGLIVITVFRILGSFLNECICVMQAADRSPQSNVKSTISSFKLMESLKKLAQVCVLESRSSQKMGRYSFGRIITINVSSGGPRWASVSDQLGLRCRRSC